MSKKQKRLFWPTLAILSFGLCVFVFARTRSASVTNQADGYPAATAAQSNNVAHPNNLGTLAARPAVGSVQLVRFTVYPEGIKPTEAHAISGTVAVYIEDLGGVSTGLIIQNSLGVRLGQVARSAGVKRGSIRLELLPGQYKVFDSTRPQHQATLVVK